MFKVNNKDTRTTLLRSKIYSLRFTLSHFCHRETKKHRHCTGQAGDLFEPPCKTFTITHQKTTELENIRVSNLANVATTFHHTEPSM